MRRLIAFTRPFAHRGQLPPVAATSNSKATLLLHVGPHKTGSTAIQSFCQRHRKHLAAAGFCYPKTGICWGQHLMLPASYLSRHPLIPKDMLGGDTEAVIAGMQNEMPPGQSLLLSSEVFWELLVDLPEAFASMLTMLDRTYHVRIILVDRPDSERTWSSIKHVARMGMPIDAATGLKDGQEACRQAHARLTNTGCPVIRVPYDKTDCVSTFLELLSSQLMPCQVAQRHKLDALVRTSRAKSSKQRENTAPTGSWCAAFTLEFSRRLLVATGPRNDYDSRIATFLQEVLDRGDTIEPVRRLPDEDAIFQRVIHASDSSTCLLTLTELRAWESICQHPAVQLAARKARCSDELRAVCQLTSHHQRAAA